jgi:hypothetical protein
MVEQQLYQFACMMATKVCAADTAFAQCETTSACVAEVVLVEMPETRYW